METLIIGLYILFGLSCFALVLISLLTIFKILKIYEVNIDYRLAWIVTLCVFFITIHFNIIRIFSLTFEYSLQYKNNPLIKVGYF
ncbi:hypothetical protein NS1R_10710 [Mammaliicoccus sciuri]|nr:hypothetical protein NS1R_10710 [Mammaliicoccus sciuri]